MYDKGAGSSPAPSFSACLNLSGNSFNYSHSDHLAFNISQIVNNQVQSQIENFVDFDILTKSQFENIMSPQIDNIWR